MTEGQPGKRGYDKYGQFEILELARCNECGAQGVIGVEYDRHSLPIYKEEPLDPAKLIIGPLGKHLCLMNGCYAKAQRQIARIETESKYRR